MLRKTWPVLCFIWFTIIAVYYPLLFAEANSVDDLKLLNGLLNSDKIDFYDLFTNTGGSYYRPFLYLTFYFDKVVWGLQESFMHLENVLLHSFNALLVFIVVRQLDPDCADRDDADPSRLYAPVAAALTFGLHPINTEPVNWISGRTDVLAGVFLLISISMLIRHLQSGRIIWLFPAAVAFFFAAITKEPALLFAPGAIWMVLVWRRGPACVTVRSLLPACAAYAVVPLVYAFIRLRAFSGNDTGVKALAQGVGAADLSMALKLKLVLKAFGFYVKKLFIPWPLNFAIYKVSDLYIAVGILAIILCLVLLYRRRPAGTFVLSGAMILAPALILPLKSMTWTPLAERYLYMPTACCCIAFGLAVSQLSFRKSQLFLVGFFVAGAMVTYSTFQRNMVWQSNLTLFRDTLDKSPGAVPILNEYALALSKAGRKDEARRIFLENGADTSNNFNLIAVLNRAEAHLAMKNFSAARSELRRKIEPGSPLYSMSLDTQVKSYEKELEMTTDKVVRVRLVNALLAALDQQRIVSGDPFYYYRMGQISLRHGNRESAGSYFSAAAKQAPSGAYYKPSAEKLAQKLTR
ncbi:MAG: hypothetical protein HGB35_05380 [Geobacteraceae bacterium]|nr:hypothetical protein [Geobacteraceae bacterium]